MTLKKEDIVRKLESQGLSKKKSTKTLETLLEIMKMNLEKGEDVLISRFGKFCVKKNRERRGRNSATDDALIGAKRIVLFKCSQVLRRTIERAKQRG
ncbi:HU family DNA-binding protein [Thermodesulfobacteriota bacterium]